MRKLEIVLGLALMTSAAVAFSLWKQLQAERALTAELRARVPPAKLPGRHPPLPAVSGAATTAPVATRVSAGESPAAPEPPPRVTGRKEDWQASQRQLLEDPRYLDAIREQRRLSYRLRRDNAMRLFGLSAETADAIVDLDIDQDLQLMSAGSTTSAEYAAAERDHDTKLLALLGQDRFEKWQTYMETRGTRMQVDRFRAQLNGADMLRDDQVEPLITALAAEQKRMRDDLENFRGTLSWDGDTGEASRQLRARQLELTTAANKRMLASAASVLTTSQVKRLEDMLANDLAQRASRERIESLRRKIGPGPTGDADPDD